jgi:hypothetical protein
VEFAFHDPVFLGDKVWSLRISDDRRICPIGIVLDLLALLIQIRTEPARREGLDRNERRGRILDVFNRGVRQRARTAAATATGEFESVVLGVVEPNIAMP